MKVIFGTTNKRKIEDLQGIINELNLNIEVLGLSDIGWDRGETEENGATVEENSMMKARAIHEFCIEKKIPYPTIADDTGLFVDSLNGEPGIYTMRYADDELAKDSTLPPYQCVIKLLRNLEGKPNRDATYKCCVTTILEDGTSFQEIGTSKGYIKEGMPSEFKKPYHYCVFALKDSYKAFNELTKDELSDTFRYNALRKTLKRLKCHEE
ncbi:MAG: non-canonical purine NTP pyrophosphatase [Bacilli bacterium]|nr:non-canonical purine NTP pyrophosphatase [Bacilli bacterium]